MSQVTLTSRDIEFFKYLHANKVATSKQIHRDIFKNDYPTFHRRLNRFVENNLLDVIPAHKTIDQSFVYSLSSRGCKIVTDNTNGIVDGKRFRSNSVNHDLHLVEVRNALSSKNIVKEYFTENQIQTYNDFNTQSELSIFKSLQVDALLNIHEQNKVRLLVPLELEVTSKSKQRYQEKMREIYYQRNIKFLFYVCQDSATEKKLKEAELDFAKDGMKKVFYTSLEDLLNTQGSVTFSNQDNKLFRLH